MRRKVSVRFFPRLLIFSWRNLLIAQRALAFLRSKSSIHATISLNIRSGSCAAHLLCALHSEAGASAAHSIRSIRSGNGRFLLLRESFISQRWRNKSLHNTQATYAPVGIGVGEKKVDSSRLFCQEHYNYTIDACYCEHTIHLSYVGWNCVSFVSSIWMQTQLPAGSPWKVKWALCMCRKWCAAGLTDRRGQTSLRRALNNWPSFSAAKSFRFLRAPSGEWHFLRAETNIKWKAVQIFATELTFHFNAAPYSQLAAKVMNLGHRRLTERWDFQKMETNKAAYYLNKKIESHIKWENLSVPKTGLSNLALLDPWALW